MAVIEGVCRIVGGVDTHKDLQSQRSPTNRIGSLERDPSPRLGKAIAKCWPGCAPSELQRIGIESTGSYGAGFLRFMQQAKVTVLEVMTLDKQDRRRRGKNDDLAAQNAAHAAFAGQRIVTPRSGDGMIELRVLEGLPEDGGERQAYRPADDPQHDRLRLPDGLRDQLRSLTRMQLIRTLASWRPDLTAYRDVDLGLSHRPQIPRPPLPRSCADEIADLDAMIAAIVERTGPEPASPAIRSAIPCAAQASKPLRPATISERLRSEASFCIAMRRQPGSGVVGKDRQASAQSWRRSRRQ